MSKKLGGRNYKGLCMFRSVTLVCSNLLNTLSLPLSISPMHSSSSSSLSNAGAAAFATPSLVSHLFDDADADTSRDIATHRRKMASDAAAVTAAASATMPIKFRF
uniref:Uncharacterized protein n=1 Tax=Leersia perrieri TaxID=77586 RepID=A0A0D9XLF2_9ORYZ